MLHAKAGQASLALYAGGYIIIIVQRQSVLDVFEHLSMTGTISIQIRRLREAKIPSGIYLPLRLLSFPENTGGVVGLTTAAGICSVTLSQSDTEPHIGSSSTHL